MEWVKAEHRGDNAAFQKEAAFDPELAGRLGKMENLVNNC